MIYRIDVQISVPLKATEVVDRVEDCITNLFPNADVRESPGEMIAETHSMDHFAERLREQSIQATARDVFRRRTTGDTFDFELKKQAALQGVVNFSVGNPDELGDMHVRVRVEEPAVEEFIDHIAPPGEE